MTERRFDILRDGASVLMTRYEAQDYGQSLATACGDAERHSLLRRVKMGVYLLGMKRQLTHGEWIPWLKMIGLHRRSAERAIQCAVECADTFGELSAAKLFDLVHAMDPAKYPSLETFNAARVSPREALKAIAARNVGERTKETNPPESDHMRHGVSQSEPAEPAGLDDDDEDDAFGDDDDAFDDDDEAAFLDDDDDEAGYGLDDDGDADDDAPGARAAVAMMMDDDEPLSSTRAVVAAEGTARAAVPSAVAAGPVGPVAAGTGGQAAVPHPRVRRGRLDEVAGQLTFEDLRAQAGDSARRLVNAIEESAFDEAELRSIVEMLGRIRLPAAV